MRSWAASTRTSVSWTRSSAAGCPPHAGSDDPAQHGDELRDVRGALQAGADGYLLKDARAADLVRAVRDLVAGRPVLVPSALAALTARAVGPDLSPREADALRLVGQGLTNAAIARRLLISESTVKTHLLHVYAKLEVTDRASAVRVAWERDLL